MAADLRLKLPDSLAVLMFNRNDNKGIIENVGLLHDVVDEIVIVDSSDPLVYDGLINGLDKYKGHVTVHRAIPFGYVEPLRMYGIKKIRSSHFLLLDADVRPSAELLKFLGETQEYGDLVYVRLHDLTFNRYYDSPALYRKGAITFRGIIHEWPIIRQDAHVSRLYLPYGLESSTSLDMWSEKYRRYYFIEAICRPFSYNYRKSVSRRRMYHMLGRSYGELPAALALGSLALIPVSVFYRDRSFRMANFEGRYNLNRYLYFRSLPRGLRSSLISISEEMYRNGGIIRYLSLDDTVYVEKLTEQFRWNMSGIQLFYALLRYRYEMGKCVSDLAQLDYR
ncbi:MAG: hypothetical protein JRM78_00540 [Nitrososphaerota archaeon]|nr:hypothetical protein [Nitrososphaerota archaeon]MDG7047415.1 hypothetical protein [Nitrososphaerota archaeon]